MEQRTVGIIEIVVASLFFGFIPIIVRLGTHLGAYNLSFFRIFIAAIAILAYMLLSGKKITPFKQERKIVLFLGAVHGFIILGYFLSIQYLSVASAVLLLYSSSIWMILFSAIFLKERITRTTLGALVLALVGVILVVSPQQLFLRESLIGSVAGLLGGIGMGLVYVLSKKVTAYDRISLTFWQNTIALPFVLPLLLIDPPSFTPTDIGLVLVLGIICTAVPFVLLYRGLQKVPGSTGGIVILLDILAPILLAFLFFGETPSLSALFGGGLIIIGSLLAAHNKDIEKMSQYITHE